MRYQSRRCATELDMPSNHIVSRAWADSSKCSGWTRSKELGTDDLAQIAASAVAGRVGTLLIEADQYPGRIHAGRAGLSSTTWRIRWVDELQDDVAGPQGSGSNWDRARRADAYADGNCCHHRF